MTTSLAALAASSTTHASSNSLMSTNLSTTNNQKANSSPGVDINDLTSDIKTEFYTREGLWKLIPSLEYVKQTQNSSNPVSPNYNNNPSQNTTSQTNQNFTINSNSDPVKISLFNFTKSQVFRDFYINTRENVKNLCYECLKSQRREKKRLNKLNESESNDEDNNDVIFKSQIYNDSSDEDDDNNWSDSDDYLQRLCRLCKVNLIRNDFIDSSDSETDDDSKKNKSSSSLSLMIFNYAREIYTYESTPVSSKVELKNIIDKKTYKTVMSTCFDINNTASISNTLSLQLSKAQNANLSNSDFDRINFSTSPSQLSLIVAAGFNKGEIHVFDVFKRDASVFYNNLKLVDKTSVTCIKWLPNTMNLFLVSYSSGNIYLYDVNYQAQSSVAPTFSKIYQNDSFSVYTNNSSSSSSTQSNTASSNSSTPNTTQNSNSHTELINNSSSNSLSSHTKKLILSNSNQQQQQQTQNPKNPLLKLNIGPDPNYSYCINQFEFSPCGKYLAIVSQDGYLRVFSFFYKNNQEMQFQLKCSMKSYFGGLLCVTWSSDGKFLATGGEDDMITVFNFIDMKVACRGRGHASWINSVSFDPWAKLSNFNFNLKEEITENDESDDESDLEDFHLKKQELEKNLEKLELEKKTKITAPKKRTISTLSDFNPAHSFTQNNSIFYRLASVGQDNQLCFWDLTEDVLKEKPNRSRITSFIQQSQYQHHHHHHVSVQPSVNLSQSDTVSLKETKEKSSLVSTAKNLFASKEKSDNDDSSISTPKSGTLTGSFFRRHKRNPSINSTSSQVTSTETKTKSSKSTPIVLNSYKKSTNLFTNLTPIENVSTPILSSNTPLDNSINSSNSRKSQNIATTSSAFNLCPKLDEVPLIEPLICKRIANERLTSIVFKKDCFLVASQDGFVNTWARPGRNLKKNKFVNETSSTCL